MTQDEINVIDPFTKKRMTDPVKNKACGHVYDRESAMAVLKMNEKTRYVNSLQFQFLQV